MNPSKFFDSEWVRLSQRLQQSLDRYTREREATEGAGRGAGAAAREAGPRRSASQAAIPVKAGDAVEAGEAALGAAVAGAATAAPGEAERERAAGPSGASAPRVQSVDGGGPIMSLGSVAGQAVPETPRFRAKIDGHSAMTLVDSGASLNFIGAEFADTLAQEACEMEPIVVKVANGAPMRCTKVYRDLRLDIQGLEFSADLYVLPIRGYDVILGMSWLRSLGPVIMIGLD
ncbi:unnamed protein product [Linum trigynum]|uniref:Uncharacterized protein n=1 Tax=Linum trigynum TaxID=586398 RepID=A0AAV2EDG5_9ROSI